MWRWFAGLVVATLLGLGSAWGALRLVADRAAIRIGPWQTSTTYGSTASSLYERADIALHALFVLNHKETLYYRARRDTAGQTLNGVCDYILRGTPPSARWWSITAYGSDDYLIANTESRFSFTAGTLALEADGSYVINVSPRPQKGNWLPVRSAPFSLTFRLYNPAAAIAANPEVAPLPTIETRCP